MTRPMICKRHSFESSRKRIALATMTVRTAMACGRFNSLSLASAGISKRVGTAPLEPRCCEIHNRGVLSCAGAETTVKSPASATVCVIPAAAVISFTFPDSPRLGCCGTLEVAMLRLRVPRLPSTANQKACYKWCVVIKSTMYDKDKTNFL